jgi:hypothetical protein
VWFIASDCPSKELDTMTADDRDPGDIKSPPTAAEIAALIDGRLSDDARAALMRRLGESEEDMDVALDAAAAVSDLTKGRVESTPVSNIATQRQRRFRGITFATVSLAAAAVAVIVLRTPRTNSESASEMVSALSSHEALPADWNYSPWPAQRGDQVTEQNSALVRIGVRTTDLEFAIRSGDSASARFANDIAAMLEDVPGGAAVGALYSEVGSSNSRARLDAARAALSGLPQQELIELGAWLESARIAATRHDDQWFKSKYARKVANRLSGSQNLSSDEKAVLTQILKGQFGLSQVAQIAETLLRSK